MCSVSVEYSSGGPAPHPVPHPSPTPHPAPTPGHKPFTPVTFAALDYTDAYEKSPHTNHGNCYRKDGRKDGVDAKYTDDQICINRDDAHCFVGWTEKGGKHAEVSLRNRFLVAFSFRRSL